MRDYPPPVNSSEFLVSNKAIITTHDQTLQKHSGLKIYYTCRVFGQSNVRRDSRRALRFYGRLFYIYVKNV